MPRKSTGGVSASGASAPSTPATKGPRKSLNGSTPDVESSLNVPSAAKLVMKQQEVALKGIESFELPRSNIIKCAKTDIPDTVQLRKEVQQALVKSATVFISYLTATAHDNCKKKKGKIITPQHVLDAFREDFGDEESIALMKAELKAYRENAAKKKTDKAAGDKKDAAEADADAEGGNEADVSRMADEADDSRIDADESSLAQDDEDQLMDED